MGRTTSAAKGAARRDAARRRRKGTGTEASRKPWKKGGKRRRRPSKTPADKARETQTRRENATKYAVALQTAREAVSTEAEVLNTMFPKHSKAYYERELFQLSKMPSQTCKTNAWNAFIRAKLKEMNDGTLL